MGIVPRWEEVSLVRGTSGLGGDEGMSVFALFTWFVTVFAGLYLLAIWLIEYDIGAPGGAVTRLRSIA